MSEELLFSPNRNNKKIKHTVKNNEYILEISETVIDFGVIVKIISFIEQLNRFPIFTTIPLIIKFKHIKRTDKLIICLLEAICYREITCHNRDIKIQFIKVDREIQNVGIISSPLNLLNSRTTLKRKEYIGKYKRDIYRNHYRRIIPKDVAADSRVLNDVLFDVNGFLKTYDIKDTTRKEIVEVVSELAGNVIEHTDSDCIIDLEVTPPVFEKEGDKKDIKYYGINIVVMNFSEKCLGDDIKALLKNEEELKDRYLEVHKALEIHSKEFNEQYKEEDFYNIAVFQDKISGRKQIAATGGTGLTKLIHSLETKSDAHRCYVISGNRGLIFEKNYLQYNQDNWIGFNDNNRFIDSTPNRKLIYKNKLFFPGTAFQLSFVMEAN